jgi:hypothetical protein
VVVRQAGVLLLAFLVVPGCREVFCARIMSSHALLTGPGRPRHLSSLTCPLLFHYSIAIMLSILCVTIADPGMAGQCNNPPNTHPLDPMAACRSIASRLLSGIKPKDKILKDRSPSRGSISAEPQQRASGSGFFSPLLDADDDGGGRPEGYSLRGFGTQASGSSDKSGHAAKEVIRS